MAQVPLGFFHYTTDDGLPHNVGYGICEDSTGFIYIGTDNGLVRFDGEDFVPASRSTGVSSPYVITSTFLPGRGVFAGLHKGQLGRLVGGTIYPEAGLNKLISYDPQPSLLASGEMLIWDAHLNQPDNLFLIARYDSAATRWQTTAWYYPNPNRPVDQLVPHPVWQDSTYVWGQDKPDFIQSALPFLRWIRTRDGRIWLGTRYGLYAFDPQTYRCQLVPATRGLAIYTVGLSPEGGLLLGSENDLLHLSASGTLRTRWEGSNLDGIEQIHVGPRGWIYFWSNRRDELFALPPHQSEAKELSLWLELSHFISCSYLDSRGHLWITTNGGGLYCLFPSLFESWPEGKLDLNRFMVSTQETEDGTFWIARQKDLLGYDSMARLSHTLTLPDPQHPDSVAFIKYIHATEGGLLIGSSTGLYFWSSTTRSLRQCIDYLPLTVKRAEHLPPYFQDWHDRALYHVDPQGRWTQAPVNQAFSVPFPPGTCSLVGAQGLYWVGSKTGLWTSDGTQPFAQIRSDSMHASTQINAVCALRDTLWLGTESGLFFLPLTTEQPQLRPWPLQGSGTTPPRIRQLVCDHQGRIWMATPTGLLCYSQGEVFTYTRSDGLICNDINHLYIDPRNALHISTSAGLARLYLDQDFSQPAPPRLVWHWLRSGEQTWEPHAQPVLNDQEVLVLRFGAIEFRDPQSIQWEYRLRTDQAWQPLFSRELTLTNLREGQYQLQVRGRQRNSAWSAPLEFNFAITLPWYRSAAIRGASVTFILGLLVLLFLQLKARREQQRARQLELQRHLADLELQGLQAQMNPHFIFNALNAIQHFVISQDVLSANEQLSRFARLIRRFLDASRKRIHSLSDELELLKEYLDMESLCYEGRFTFELRSASTLDLSTVFIPAMLIQPLAENAIRHGLLPRGESGHLLIYLRPLGERVVCIIEDNGIGRRASQQGQKAPGHQSQGLALLHDRIETFNRADMGPIHLQCVDLLSPEGRPRGTRVLLTV